MKSRESRRQSRAMLATVLAFLVFDFAALALNVWLSGRIEAQAVAINLAGRQRMLSQRMAKVLLQLERPAAAQATPASGAEPLAPLLAELRQAFELFDSSLQGFARGQTIRGGAGELVRLDPITGSDARALVEQAETLWAPHRQRILAMLETPAAQLPQVLAPAVAYSGAPNVQLLDLMNRLTTELERETRREAGQIRLAQGAAFVLALFNFIGAVMLYQRRLRRARHSQDLLDEIIRQVSACVMVLDSDADTVLRSNRSCERLFGYDAGQLQGLSLRQLVHDADGALHGRRADGTSFLLRLDRNAAHLGSERLFVATATDITQQHQTEQHLEELAYHDALTQLPNRLLFDDRLRTEMAHAQRRGTLLGVLFIDLDHFKPINDTYGHEAGDVVLREVARRLRQSVRASDSVARRGGDEFCAVLTDLHAPEACVPVAALILERLTEPYDIGSALVRVGASIGISLFPTDGDTAELLLARADAAMYHAKQAGGRASRFYSEATG